MTSLIVIAVILFFLLILYALRGNRKSYGRTIGEEFRPLTHIEIMQKKPFLYHFHDKWTYECRLYKTSNLVAVWNAKDAVIENINRENESEDNYEIKTYKLQIGFYQLRELLYRIGEKPRGIIKRFQYRYAFHRAFLDDAESFMHLFNNMLDYQSRLAFFFEGTTHKESDTAKGIFKDGWRSFIAGTNAWSEIFLEFFSGIQYTKEKIAFENQVTEKHQKEMQRKNRQKIKKT